MKSFASALVKEKAPEISGNFTLTGTENFRIFARSAFSSKLTFVIFPPEIIVTRGMWEIFRGLQDLDKLCECWRLGTIDSYNISWHNVCVRDLDLTLLCKRNKMIIFEAQRYIFTVFSFWAIKPSQLCRNVWCKLLFNLLKLIIFLSMSTIGEKLRL